MFRQTFWVHCKQYKAHYEKENSVKNTSSVRKAFDLSLSRTKPHIKFQCNILIQCGKKCRKLIILLLQRHDLDTWSVIIKSKGTYQILVNNAIKCGEKNLAIHQGTQFSRRSSVTKLIPDLYLSKTNLLEYIYLLQKKILANHQGTYRIYSPISRFDYKSVDILRLFWRYLQLTRL
jgi:hypothetical protein